LLYADALSCGVDFRFNARVSSLSQTQDKVELVADSWCGSYDALVIADGADSELRVQAGLGIRATPYPWGALWGLFDVKSWPYGTTLLQHYKGTRQMFGLMPTQVTDDRTTLSFFWSLKHAEVDGWRAASLDAFREMLVGLWPESVPVVEQLKTHSQLAVARYQHAWPRRLGVPRIFIAGDSAHSMSPSLGLGSTLAVQDALAIAQCLETSGPVDGPQAYSKVRLGRIQRFQWLSRALTPCFQSDGEGLGRDLIFGLGARLAPVRWLMRQSLSA
jgi:2-polyprenyl-6-methoxyphenol hydroxylase-like FAD-dependent oxidoreductase